METEIVKERERERLASKSLVPIVVGTQALPCLLHSLIDLSFFGYWEPIRYLFCVSMCEVCFYNYSVWNSLKCVLHTIP